MYETVAEADNLRPGDFWVTLSHIFGNSAGSLACDLQQPRQSEIQEPVGVEVGAGSAAREGDCLPRMIKHVAQGCRAAVMLAHTAPPLPPTLVHGCTDSRTAAYSGQPGDRGF